MEISDMQLAQFQQISLLSVCECAYTCLSERLFTTSCHPFRQVMGSSGETPASLEVKVYKEVCASVPGPCSVAAWLLHGQAHVSEEKPENVSMLLQ